MRSNVQFVSMHLYFLLLHNFKAKYLTLYIIYRFDKRNHVLESQKHFLPNITNSLYKANYMLFLFQAVKI
jgi:hypothetical protein